MNPSKSTFFFPEFCLIFENCGICTKCFTTEGQ